MTLEEATTLEELKEYLREEALKNGAKDVIQHNILEKCSEALKYIRAGVEMLEKCLNENV